ncbi:MAG: hypothetical protein IKR68_09055 [Lachnospiraceae bacterium]|nr:hypothetical protein [Lachnospiraceae bacterium]
MDKKQIPLLLGLLGVVAAVMVYLFYFKPTMEHVNQLKAEDVKLQARITELEALRDQRDFFIEETEKMSKKVDEIYEQFPENVLPEDAIWEAIDTQDKAGGANLVIGYDKGISVYKPIGVSVDEMAASQAASEDADSAEEGDSEEKTEEKKEEKKEETVDTKYDLIQQDTAYTFECDLNQFLRAAQAVNERNNRDVIKLVAMAYDETTGLLTTEMDIAKYYVTGRGLDYTPATFSVPTGSNLFSTQRISAPAEDGEAEPAAAQ